MHCKRHCSTLVLCALLSWLPSAGRASSLTLDMSPCVSCWGGAQNIVSGAMVSGGPIQDAAFEMFYWDDFNNNGVFDGPDARLGAQATYSNGVFGFLARAESWGLMGAAWQQVPPRGILTIDDMMITSSSPNPPSSVPATLSFHVSGSTSHYNRATNPDLVTSDLFMTVRVAGNTFDGRYGWSEFDNSNGTGLATTDNVTGLGTQIAGGAFVAPFSATVTTPSFDVPVGTPFTLQIEFVVSAGTGGGGGNQFSSWGGMVFDALNTMGFLPNQPIFGGLPAGYTVASVDAGIANNVFGAGSVAVEPKSFGQIKSLYRDDPR